MKIKKYSNLIDKIQNTSFTEKDVYLCFFLPIYKLSGNSKIYKDFKGNGNKLIINGEYGKVEIRNRLLTEFHLKIFDAIIYCGTAALLEENRVGIYYEEADVLKYLNMKTNHTKFRETVKQIADARYYVNIEDYSYSIGIIQKHYTKKETGNSKNLIILDPDYVKNQKLNFGVNYKKIYDKISNIKYHTIPSIVRHVIITSKTYLSREYDLIDVLKKIGFPIESEKGVRNIRSDLNKYASDLEKSFGIQYDHKSKKLYYSNLNQVEFSVCDIDSLKQYHGKIFSYRNNDYIIRGIMGESGNFEIITDQETLELNLFYDDLLEYLKKNTKDNSQNRYLGKSLFEI